MKNQSMELEQLTITQTKQFCLQLGIFIISIFIFFFSYEIPPFGTLLLTAHFATSFLFGVIILFITDIYFKDKNSKNEIANSNEK